MNLLLDTHIWLWSQLEPKKLGRRVTAELSNTGNELWISPVSVWEALTLMQKGRVRVENPYGWAKRYNEQLREAPLTSEISPTAAPGPSSAVPNGPQWCTASTAVRRRPRISMPGSGCTRWWLRW